MSDSSAGGSNRTPLVTLLVCVALFLALVAVINPVGDALIAAGLPVPVFATVLTVVALAFVAVPVVVWRRSLNRRRVGQLTGHQTLVDSWAASAGWRPGAWQGGLPMVLDRFRVRSSAAVSSAHGAVAGLPATIAVWEQHFTNLGSPISDRAVWLVVAVDGLPEGASVGMGKSSGDGAISSMPIRWAGTPPKSLAQSAGTRPWGFTRTAIWPGPGTPPPPAWASVAAELDSLSGWLLVHRGRLEVCARVRHGQVHPERLLAVANQAIGVLRGPALR
ncbi:hypothetical protein ACQBAU_00190 [Propionibacteriaceae bacterium Y2011]